MKKGKRVLRRFLDGRVHWSASSLMDSCSLFPHGRGHLYIGDMGTNKGKTIGLEWSLGKRQNFCGVTLELNAVDGNGGACLFIGIPWLFAIWLTLEGFIPRNWLPGHWYTSPRDGKRYYRSIERNIGVRVFDQAIWISLWENPMEWNKDDPWWWQFNIKPLDIVLGKEKHSSRTLLAGRVIVPMPEKEYLADYRLFESTWKRPRWPWAERLIRVEIENDEPIPLPGKGENSWDCCDDASYSITMVCDGTVKEAAIEYAAGIVRDRIRRGGPEKWPIENQS